MTKLYFICLLLFPKTNSVMYLQKEFMKQIFVEGMYKLPIILIFNRWILRITVYIDASGL